MWGEVGGTTLAVRGNVEPTVRRHRGHHGPWGRSTSSSSGSTSTETVVAVGRLLRRVTLRGRTVHGGLTFEICSFIFHLVPCDQVLIWRVYGRLRYS